MNGNSSNIDLVAKVHAALLRAPAWVRKDLSTKDEAVRARAEETLAAMIAAALEEGGASNA